MRIVRFISGGGKVQIGEMLDDGTAGVLKGDFARGFERTGETAKVEKLLAPIVPTDILCIGLNYRDHAAEGGFEIPQNPMLFIKAGNTLNNPGDAIAIPRRSNSIDYEGELVAVIGKSAKNVSRERAHNDAAPRQHHSDRHAPRRRLRPQATSMDEGGGHRSSRNPRYWSAGEPVKF